jgi:hypothetical protein
MKRALTLTFATAAAVLALTACDPAATSTGSDQAGSNPTVGITTHSVVVSGSGNTPTTAAKPHNLAHGDQQGFANCVIDYKDAQMGAGSTTFTAYILSDKGTAFSPADSDPYSVMLQMTITDASGGQHAVSENFGSGTRTAADNGGSDWFTTNQGDVQVSADGTHGMLTATVQEQLAAVSGVTGSITIMGNSDNSVTTKDCVVRPG